jgi:cytochrome c2
MAISADALGDTAAKSAGADNQLVFNNICRTCDTLKQGDNRLGPNLPISSVGRRAHSVLPFNAYQRISSRSSNQPPAKEYNQKPHDHDNEPCSQ